MNIVDIDTENVKKKKYLALSHNALLVSILFEITLIFYSDIIYSVIKIVLLMCRIFGKENNDGNSSDSLRDSTSNSTTCQDDQVQIDLLTPLLEGCFFFFEHYIRTLRL